MRNDCRDIKIDNVASQCKEVPNVLPVLIGKQVRFVLIPQRDKRAILFRIVRRFSESQKARLAILKNDLVRRLQQQFSRLHPCRLFFIDIG